jgi:lysophospholipase L1-like esterase
MLKFIVGLMLLSQNPYNTYNDMVDAVYEQEATCYEKTIEINDINEVLLEKYGKNLEGKKITCIGDSITYGNGGSLKEDGTRVSYCDYLEGYTKEDVINLGIGGAPIGDYWDDSSLILRWEEIPEDSDIILVFAGTNDYFIGEYGDIDEKEEKTFCGDAYTLLEDIKGKYTDSDIYVVLTYQNEAQYWNGYKENDFGKYMNTLKMFAMELDLNVIDLTNTDFLNSNDAMVKKELIPDSVHPNDKGNEILANMLAANMCMQ